MTDASPGSDWWLAADGKRYPPKGTPTPPELEHRTGGWSVGTVVTFIGVIATLAVSGLSLWLSHDASDTQNHLQQKLAELNRSATAPRTEVDFGTGSIDAVGQTLTLDVSVKEVGPTKGLDCKVTDTDSISAKPTGAPTATTTRELVEPNGDIAAGFDLDVGQKQDLELQYHRHEDGFISLLIGVTCGQQDSTTKALGVQVLSANGALEPGVSHLNP